MGRHSLLILAALVLASCFAVSWARAALALAAGQLTAATAATARAGRGEGGPFPQGSANDRNTCNALP
jgi:hypothetical protein